MSVSNNVDEPQVAPHLRVELRGRNNVSHAVEARNGDQILWVNPLEKSCFITFFESSPFLDQSTRHHVSAGGHTLSPPIQGPSNSQHRYKVEYEDDDDGKGDPVIIIKS